MQNAFAKRPSAVPANPDFRKAQVPIEFIERHSSNFNLQLNSHDCDITFINRSAEKLENIKITVGFSALKILSEHLAMMIQAIEEKRGKILILKGSHPDERYKQSLLATLEAFQLEE